MADALKENDSLSEINLEINNPGYDYFSRWHLKKNNIGNDGAKLLEKALKTNKTLRSLDVSGNPFLFISYIYFSFNLMEQNW